MARKDKKYQIFISYRRDGGEIMGKMLYDRFTALGYHTFYDVESLRSGKFNIALYEVIDECDNFLLVLSPGALDRCWNEGDWVRLEIEHALKKKKNIVPIMLRNFSFPEKLPPSIEPVRYMNAPTTNLEYFDAFIEKLEKFLVVKEPKSIDRPEVPEKPDTPEKPDSRFNRKLLTAVGAVAGILIVAACVLFLPKSDTAPSPSPDSEEGLPTGITSEVSGQEGNTEQEAVPAYRNVLMEDKVSFGEEESPRWVLGKEGLERSSILSVTFLNTLEDMPEDAWDVSKDKNEFVKAWVKPAGQTRRGTDGYDLYIGSQGNIVAGSCHSLFAYYDSVTEINFNHCFFTDEADDMFCMFYKCSSLETLDLSEFDTSQVKSMYYMFSQCANLKSIDFGSFDTGNVTTMECMFAGCSSLEELGLHSFDTSNVTVMKSMFRDCSSLKSLNLRNFDTGNVTTAENMFLECSSLNDLDLGSFDTSNVTTMKNMFYGCSSLESLDLSSFGTSNVAEMENMFFGCSSLEEIELGSFDTSNVTTMGDMFCKCDSLKQLDLGSFNTSNVTNMYCMFGWCSNLEALDISSFDTSKATNMEFMFYGCSSLTDLDLSGFTVNAEANTENILYGAGITEEEAGLPGQQQ